MTWRRPPAQPDPPTARRLLEGCDESQRDAITSPAQPLCVVAGAGSGKTRVLTRRIAWRVGAGDAAPAHVLALTFTRKAAGELRGRLRHLGVADQVTAGTFHSVALAQLRRIASDRREQPPAVLASKARILSRILPQEAESGMGAGSGTGGPRRSVTSEVAAEIEWAKAKLVPPERYAAEAAAAGRHTMVGLAEVAEIYGRYESERRRQHLLDFEDLLTTLARLFSQDPDVAAAQRWRFRHLFVDEFQDVNRAQLALLEGWLGSRTDLCVVGDPAQAIYSWNGADPAVMTSVRERWPGITVIPLASNYRSTPQILALARSAVAPAPAPRRPAAAPSAALAAASLFDSAAPVSIFHPAARAVRADGPIPTVTRYESDRQEAVGVAAEIIRSHRPGRRWSAIAVLARTNAQLAIVAEACRSARIPHRSLDSLPFARRPAVVEALAGLPADADAGRLAGWLADLEHPAGADAGEGTLDREMLADLGREFALLDPSGGAATFSSWLRHAFAGETVAPGADVVELATFHRAKGLEWPVVFVTGLEDGLVPIGPATDDERLAEERRLLYVALTRAEDELHCSWSAARTFGSKVLARQPSPWLPAIEAARRTLLGVSTAGRSSRDGFRSVRETLAARHAGGSSPDGLEGALLAWRARAARAADVPAHVILPDKTIEGIIAARPRTTGELLAIPGIGPMRADSYAQAIFELVRLHCPPDRPPGGAPQASP